jgi:hypothetical protein
MMSFRARRATNYRIVSTSFIVAFLNDYLFLTVYNDDYISRFISILNTYVFFDLLSICSPFQKRMDDGYTPIFYHRILIRCWSRCTRASKVKTHTDTVVASRTGIWAFILDLHYGLKVIFRILKEMFIHTSSGRLGFFINLNMKQYLAHSRRWNRNRYNGFLMVFIDFGDGWISDENLFSAGFDIVKMYPFSKCTP